MTTFSEWFSKLNEQFFTEEGTSWDNTDTPWMLEVKMEEHPLRVFFYYPTQREAEEQESKCKALGWRILGIQNCMK